MPYVSLENSFSYKDLVTHTRLDELADNDEYLRGGSQLATKAIVNGTVGTGGTLATSLSVTGPGMLCAVWLASTKMGAIRVVITIDGVTVVDVTASFVNYAFLDEMLSLVAPPSDHTAVEYCRGIYLPFWETLVVQAAITANGMADLYDDFQDGTLAKWTVTGSMQVESYLSSLRVTNRSTTGWPAMDGWITCAQPYAYGVWQFVVACRLNPAGGYEYCRWKFVRDGAGDYYSILIWGQVSVYHVDIEKNGVQLATAALVGSFYDATMTLRIERDTDGTMRVYEDGTLRLTHVDATITASVDTEMALMNSTSLIRGTMYADDVCLPNPTAPSLYINHAIPLE